MSDFQSRFMGVVAAANNTNLSLLARYGEDSAKAFDDLYWEMAKIQYAKAQLDNLRDSNRLRLFFRGIEERFRNDLKKFSHEFTAEVNETYRSYDKKLKTLLSEEGVRAKDLYTHIDGRSEEEYSVFAAKADQVDLVTDALSEAQTQAAEQSDKIVKKVKRLKTLTGVVIPLILLLLTVSMIFLFVGGISSLVSSGRDAVPDINTSFEVVDNVIDGVLDIAEGTVKAAASIKTAAIIAGIVSVAYLLLWFIYYFILGFVMKNILIRRLGDAMAGVYNAFNARRTEMQDAYTAWLKAHFEFMNAQYFMKYKPLIDIVVNQKGEL